MGAGQTFGSGQLIRSGAQLGAGALLESTVLGVSPQMGAGLAAATVGGANLTRNLWLAMSNPTGRTLLKSLLTNSDGAITPRAAAVLSAFAASQLSQ